MTDSRKSRRIGQTSPRWLALALTIALGATACAEVSSQDLSQAVTVSPAQQSDDRPLEEKVDTDGDGEMSDEEIEAYARSVLLDFSNCMRASGFPDFTDLVLEDLLEAGQGQFLALMADRGVVISDPNAVPTLRSCGENLSDLQTFAPQPSDAEAEAQEVATLEFAACMRDEGISNWPDPDFAENPGNGYGPELLQGIDVQSDEVQDTIAQCQAANSSAGAGLENETSDEDTTTHADATADEPDDQPQPEEDIDRAPISPLIEGDTSDLNVAEVTRRDLTQTTTLAGTLDFGAQRPFPTNTTGIVTALPSEGDLIGFGEVLFAVDGEPVLLLEGAAPQYRPFTSNMSDGNDVEQLEQNLVALGYADDLDLTVDQDFTAITRDAVEELQVAFDVEDTGRLDLGRIVFSPAPVRIGQVNVELGQSISPQVTVLSVTESDQRITLDLDAEDRSLLSVGADVDIELPDSTTVPGLVVNIASTATRVLNAQGGDSGERTIEVTIEFLGTPPADAFDSAPVDVIVTEEVIADVLTVPVPSLVALSGGGHAVELIVQGGTRLIEVELGDFVDDIVEVRGDLQEGDRVVMATAG